MRKKKKDVRTFRFFSQVITVFVKLQYSIFGNFRCGDYLSAIWIKWCYLLPHWEGQTGPVDEGTREGHEMALGAWEAF